MAKPLSEFPRLKRQARSLRQDQTDAEVLLWQELRSRQLNAAKFRRQAQIGPYICDFVCHEVRLIVELDGGQHSAEKDAARTQWLESRGYRVLRFWNNEVLKNLDGVRERIAQTLPSSG